jgi:hypothetical protein
MEQSDHDAFVEAQSYADGLLLELEFSMCAAEVAYLRYLEEVLYR